MLRVVGVRVVGLRVRSRGWGFYGPFDRPVDKTLAVSFSLDIFFLHLLTF